MQIVAGISLKGIKPRVWDKNSPYYLPELRAIMVSYACYFISRSGEIPTADYEEFVEAAKPD